MTDEPADAVVVGSGAGGGAMAWALASRGLNVVLLEAGPHYNPLKDYRLDRPDWERGRFPAKVDTGSRHIMAPLPDLDPADDELRSWNNVFGRYNPTGKRANWGYQHVVGLGGSTLHFTGEAHRLHPQSMDLHMRFGVAADWPVTYEELEPFYVAAEGLMGVAGPSSDDVRWRSAPYPLPPHPLSYASRRLAEGCRVLGLSMVQNSRAALSLPYDDRPDCNYCGQCNRGCPRRDKGSADVTFIRRALETNKCVVRTSAHVVRVTTGANDRVSGVEYIDAEGRMNNARGRVVVIACGAVETPRLLLASAGLHAEDGLANESGGVGRNFMETLYWTSVALHPEPLGSYRGLPADGIVWSYNAPDAIPDVVGGCRFVSGVHEADMTGPVAYAQRIAGGWGVRHRVRMQQLFGHAIAVGAIGECLPNARAFIDLDPEATDEHGVPRARIHAHLGEAERRRLAVMAETSRAILSAAGAPEVVEEYGAWDAFSATHVFGTCRMGNDPDSSVVNRWGRSHRWRNLFITDASVFPSSGGGEGPALTVSALAIRTAAHIADLAAGLDL